MLGHSTLSQGRLGLSKSSEERFWKRLCQLTRRNRGISLDRLINELNPVLRGWLNYFRYACMDKRLEGIEGWLKRRLRCYRLKQCKRALGIARFLMKQGVPEWRSWITAVSGKGWHRLSGSPSVHEAMNNKWFATMGLFSMVGYYRSNFKETALYVRRTQGGVRGR